MSEKGPYHVDIFLNSVKTDFDVTLMDEDNFQKFSNGSNPLVNRATEPVLICCKTYSDQAIAAIGTSTVLIEYNNEQSILELVIVRGTVKELMCSSTLLVYYIPELLIDCDSLPHVLGAMLSHRFQYNVEKPICYASLTVAQAETKYSQVEKEGSYIWFKALPKVYMFSK